MAERRMFAKTIIDSDAFLEMPLSSQALYFHLSMRADDEGFINNPKKIQRMIGASDDDLKVLIAKSFIIPFESGIVVIKHWKIHNYIRGDRIHETKYLEEKALLNIKKNGSYTISSDICQSDVSQVTDKSQAVGIPRLGKVSIGKVSIDKDNKKKKELSYDNSEKEKVRFVPPTIEEVKAYCEERHNNIDPEYFVAFYESKGWMVGKNKMKSWKSAVITWEKNNRDKGGVKNGKSSNTTTKQYTDEQLERFAELL